MKVICKKILDNRMSVGKIYDIIYDPLQTTFRSPVFKYYLIGDNSDKIYMSEFVATNRLYFSGIDEVRNKKLEDLGI